ncbi:hypothetical protein RMATCC62417_00302 [Rhizopus microsporus]|nr:hypothetical protein RMATCC62417_00302 [Rhizopus microsporus]
MEICIFQQKIAFVSHKVINSAARNLEISELFQQMLSDFNCSSREISINEVDNDRFMLFGQDIFTTNLLTNLKNAIRACIILLNPSLSSSNMNAQLFHCSWRTHTFFNLKIEKPDFILHGCICLSPNFPELIL